MPTVFRGGSSLTGLDDLAQSVAAFPLVRRLNRDAQINSAALRQARLAQARQSLADATKTQVETDRLRDQDQLRASLGRDLDRITAFNQGVALPVVGPPDNFVAQRAVPSLSQRNDSLANALRAFGGNAQQAAEALRSFERQRQAVGAERAVGAGNLPVASALNAIAAGNAIPAQFDSTGVNRFTGDASSPMARASIAAKNRSNQPGQVPNEIEGLFAFPLFQRGKPVVNDFTGEIVTQTDPVLMEDFVKFRAQNGIMDVGAAYTLWLRQLAPEIRTRIERLRAIQSEMMTAPDPEPATAGVEPPGILGSLRNLAGRGVDAVVEGLRSIGGGDPAVAQPAPTPPAPAVPPTAAASPEFVAQMLDKARAAIAQGRDPAQVQERLRAMGIDPGQL